MAQRRWTLEEDAFIERHYPDGGAVGCLRYMAADRTERAVYNRARKLGIRSTKQSTPHIRRYEQSDEIDRAITDAFLEPPRRGMVDDLARRLDRPRWWVSKRAAALGCVEPRFPSKRWSERERDIVRRNAHLTAHAIEKKLAAAGFNRTPAAIGLLMKRRKFERQHPDAMSGHTVARLLGVDPTTVKTWIRDGKLRSDRRGTERLTVQGGDQHMVSRAQVRTFVIAHPTSVDLRKVDREWFIEVMSLAEAPPELIEAARLDGERSAAATIRQLREENDVLRERIVAVEEEMQTEAQALAQTLGIAPMPSKLLNFLRRRSRTSKEAALINLGCEDKGPQIIDVHVSTLRKALAPHSIKITTLWGEGFALQPDDRRKLNALLDGAVASERCEVAA